MQCTRKGYISRRDFIKVTAVLVAGAGLAACEPKPALDQENVSMPMGMEDQYPDIPFAPPEPPPYVLAVFTTEEARTVEALTARIYPGDESDPGAREAGVTNFIDKELAFHDGYVKYTYTQGPHAKAYEGDRPPPEMSDELGPVIWVKKSELERYGYQSLLPPVQRYHNGIASVDKYSQATFGRKFVDLSEAEQDQVLADMKAGKASDYFEDPTDKEFFKMLQEDTVEGMFSDPAYGGNRDMIGWKQIGYPGAQRAYTPVDMNTEGPVRPPQSLAMLHRFHAGMNSGPQVIVPSSGSQLTPEP